MSAYSWPRQDLRVIGRHITRSAGRRWFAVWRGPLPELMREVAGYTQRSWIVSSREAPYWL